VLVVVTLTHGSVWGSYATGIHGSPWDDDCHVPLVFYGPGIKGGRYEELAGVVSIGPTFARMIGASPTEPVDGHVLTSAIR
jgi:arylsulfatase A-like enzyme